MIKPTLKKAFYALTTSTLFVCSAFSQTNTLPTSGNVGIGTTTPTSKLQVNGSARIDSMLLVKDSIVVNKTATIQSDLKVIGNTSLKNDLKVGGNTTLVGTTVIKEGDLKIKTLGDSTLADDGVLMINANGKVKNGGDLKSLVYSQPALPPCKDDAGGNITPAPPIWLNGPGKLYTSYACVPDVKVGIGETNPQAKLHIKLNPNKETHPIIVEDGNNFKLLQLNENGTLLSRKVRVDMQNWADYVFSDDYELMDLDSLEQFIIQNHHLPDIQTTDSVLQEGIDLGEMNRLLLQKVEELTLYILQEKRRNQELEDRLKRIEEKLNK